MPDRAMSAETALRARAGPGRIGGHARRSVGGTPPVCEPDVDGQADPSPRTDVRASMTQRRSNPPKRAVSAAAPALTM